MQRQRHAREAVERMAEEVAVEAAAVVEDVELDVAVSPNRAPRDLFGAMAESAVDDVVEGLFEPQSICVDK